MRTSKVISWVGCAAVAGLIVFGLMAWRSVSVERSEPDDALRQFTEIRSAFSTSEPILRMQPDGRVVRSKEPVRERQAPKQFHVLAYRATERQLVRANVAFWFLRTKGPAMKYALRGTGLDFDRLGISPGDLAQYGPTLVLDETGADGGRLLV
jgi:hypothetical protein